MIKRWLFIGSLYFLLTGRPPLLPAYVSNQLPDLTLGPLNGSIIDSDGMRLFVILNNQVLICNSIPTINNASPDVILSGFNHPYGLATDGTHLFIADTINNNILIYNAIPTTNTASPDVVLGGFNNPWGVGTDGKRLYVADTNNGNTLIYNSIPTTNSALPDITLSGHFAQNVRSDGIRLYVTDSYHSQVLIYNSIPTASNALPDVVLGGFNHPNDANSDGTRFFIADSGNGQFLIYNSIPTTNTTLPDIVLSGFAVSRSIMSDGARIYVTSQNGGFIYYPHPWVSPVSPNYGVAGKIVQVSISGYNSTSTSKFSHTGDPTIVTSNTNQVGKFNLLYILNLNNVVPDVYNVTITGNAYPRILNQAFIVLSPLVQPVSWNVNDLGPAGGNTAASYACGLDIGDADQDNQQELYIGNGDVALFQEKKYSSGWGVPSALPAPAGNFSHMLLADGDTDSNWEAYCTSLSKHVIQFKGPTWSFTDLGADNSGSTKINAMAAADLDHDGLLEIYTAGNIINGVICQFRNTGTAWAQTAISGYAGSGQTLALAIGDGQNDGNFEIYTGNSDQNVYQYILNNKTWQVKSLGACTGMPNAIAVGDGDNDGQREVYAACQDGKVLQFHWNGSWTGIPIGNPGGAAMNAVAVSDADNDGSNEVYAACQDGHLYMYKKVMSSWTTVDLGAAKTPLLAMAIGDADNDHQFEVYALGQNNHIFQFKAASVLSPTITPTPTTNITDFFGSDKRLKVFHSQINPTKGEKARIRWYQPNDAGVNLVIYNLLGDKIITLANNRSFAAGQIYEIDWDGRTSRGAMAGSGIYIVLLQAGEYQARAKVAVVK